MCVCACVCNGGKPVPMVRSECLGKLGTGRCSTLMPIFLSPGLGAARKLNEMRFLFPSSECSTSGWRGWMLGCCCCCCTGVCTGSVPCCIHVSAQPKKKNVMCTAARLDGSFPPRLEVPNDNTTTHCSRLAAGGFFALSYRQTAVAFATRRLE